MDKLKEMINLGKKEYTKSVKTSSYPYYSWRSVPVLIHQEGPGLETIVFEGIEGAGLSYFHKRLEEKFKQELDIPLPLYRDDEIDRNRKAFRAMDLIGKEEDKEYSTFRNFKHIVEVKEEGCTYQEAGAVAEEIMSNISHMSVTIDYYDIKYQPEWTSKAYPYYNTRQAYVIEPEDYPDPRFRHIAMHRSIISSYVYGLIALLGKNEISKLVNKYYDDEKGSSCKWATNFIPTGHNPKSEDEDNWVLYQPDFLYELVHLPKVQEFTSYWALLVSRVKTDILRYPEPHSFKEIDHLVYVSTLPEVAHERLKRVKQDNLTYVEDLECLRFTWLLYNALYTCVLFKGHGDEHIESEDDGLYNSIQRQLYRVLENTRIEAEDRSLYDYALFDWINILKDMFNVRNMRVIFIENNHDSKPEDNQEEVDKLYKLIDRNYEGIDFQTVDGKDKAVATRTCTRRGKL